MTSAPAVVDITPYRSAVPGEGDHEHLLAVLTGSAAYGTWRIHPLDLSNDRAESAHPQNAWAAYPQSYSQPGLTRDEAVALAQGWVTGELTVDDLRARTQR